jgi:predicted permease
VAFAVSWLFGLDGLTRGVFILQCMMPVAVATYLWVERYGPEEAPGVAAFILVSTILSANRAAARPDLLDLIAILSRRGTAD